MGSLSIFHWLIILVIVIVLFGANRLPKIGEGLGKGIRAFKDELNGAAKKDEAEKLEDKVVEGKVEKKS